MSKDRFDDVEFYRPENRLGPKPETEEERQEKINKIVKALEEAAKKKAAYTKSMECTGVIDYPKLEKRYGSLNELAAMCHEASKQWWFDLKTGEPLDRNVGELLMLMVSELAEAMEGDRKGLMDDKLPHRPMIEVELVDCIIRILDFAGAKGLDLQGAFEEKLAYNAGRVDHTKEHRLAEGGKKY